jgi:hypothetical protein
MSPKHTKQKKHARRRSTLLDKQFTTVNLSKTYKTQISRSYRNAIVIQFFSHSPL